MYRIRICVEDGTIVGRQDRELDLELFTKIITGTRPQGDGLAHNRDSSEHGGLNRTCYYYSIWNPAVMAWIEVAQPEDVTSLYSTCAQESFNG
jgi:hypothetical protein